MKKVLLIILTIIFSSSSLKSEDAQFLCIQQNIDSDQFGSQKYVSLEIKENEYFYKFQQLSGGRYFLDKSIYNDNYSDEELSEKFHSYNRLEMIWDKNYLEIFVDQKGTKYYFDFINYLFGYFHPTDYMMDKYYACEMK